MCVIGGCTLTRSAWWFGLVSSCAAALSDNPTNDVHRDPLSTVSRTENAAVAVPCAVHELGVGR
jgi:hypothetical protein